MSVASLPQYSVLMSVYAKDKPDYLEAAIASMVRQSEPFKDLVIVCDGPLAEGLVTVLDRWQHELRERMRVFRLTENAGLGAALEAGLPLCRCDVVARMDADDISRPDRCRLLLEKMRVDNLDLVGGAIEEFERQPGDMGSVRSVPLDEKGIGLCLKKRNPFNHMTVMFDRRAVDKVGGYQPFPWLEDYWLWARMIAGGCRCANIANVVVDVRVGDGMYARRSNWAYFKSQRHFFSELRRLGLIGRCEQLRAVAVRAIGTLFPVRVVKAVYNVLLRDRA